ncbi:DinB family protein [Nocardia sp. NPDC052566]|uniref:DinB family protein n=1 Tax=Nocardia sp. NPDC052566 TaxID=3364330 RepID=UPI0037C932F6
MTDSPIDRDALAADLERVRADFHHLLDNARETEWAAPTSGTRWTNEQLLFHMAFGYMITQKLLIIARFFGRLPHPVGRAFAAGLNAATGPFHTFNYYGSCHAARVFNRYRMGGKLDRVLDALQRSLARETARSLTRGMHYPTRWDPYFHDYMTLADIYRFPGEHYNHHRRQLTLAATQ